MIQRFLPELFPFIFEPNSILRTFCVSKYYSTHIACQFLLLTMVPASNRWGSDWQAADRGQVDRKDYKNTIGNTFIKPPNSERHLCISDF